MAFPCRDYRSLFRIQLGFEVCHRSLSVYPFMASESMVPGTDRIGSRSHFMTLDPSSGNINASRLYTVDADGGVPVTLGGLY